MAAVWPAGPEPMMTSLLCILRVRERVGGLTVGGERSGALGLLWAGLEMETATSGRAMLERRGREEPARRKALANSLATLS